LLVINAILPSVAIVTLDDYVATGPPPTIFLHVFFQLSPDYSKIIGLEIALVACNTSAGVILLGMLLYKAIERSCVFNNFKSDRKALFCVALLDLCRCPVACPPHGGCPRGVQPELTRTRRFVGAAVGWSVRLDRKGICAKAGGSRGTGASPCSLNAALVAAGLVLAWISVIIGACHVTSSSGS
jgi:hypothetical protein